MRLPKDWGLGKRRRRRSLWSRCTPSKLHVELFVGVSFSKDLYRAWTVPFQRDCHAFYRGVKTSSQDRTLRRTVSSSGSRRLVVFNREMVHGEFEHGDTTGSRRPVRSFTVQDGTRRVFLTSRHIWVNWEMEIIVT